MSVEPEQGINHQWAHILPCPFDQEKRQNKGFAMIMIMLIQLWIICCGFLWKWIQWKYLAEQCLSLIRSDISWQSLDSSTCSLSDFNSCLDILASRKRDNSNLYLYSRKNVILHLQCCIFFSSLLESVWSFHESFKLQSVGLLSVYQYIMLAFIWTN